MGLEETLDTGGVYRRAEVDIGEDETLDELRARLGRSRHRTAPRRAGRGFRSRRNPRSASRRRAPKVEPGGAASRLGPPGGRAAPDRAAGPGVDHLPGPAPARPCRPAARRGQPSRSRRRRPTPGTIDGAAGGDRRRLARAGTRCRPKAGGGNPPAQWRRGCAARAGRTARTMTPAVAQRRRPRRTGVAPPPPRHRGAGAHRARAAPTPTSSSPRCSTRSRLSPEDRRLVTELAYGATRQRRALDHLVDGFLLRPVDGPTRAALRVGAYQLAMLRRPGPRRGRSPPSKPSPARPASWSTPSCAAWPSGWRRDRPAGPTRPPGSPTPTGWSRASTRRPRRARRGRAGARGHEPPGPGHRAGRRLHPGPRLASGWPSSSTCSPGQRVADLCAAPGGKATAPRRAGSDGRRARPQRSPGAGLVAANGRRLRSRSGSPRSSADGRRPPLRPGSFERVLVDAPCSGLGALRRRPDARWRDRPGRRRARLAGCSGSCSRAAAELLAPGGVLVYSVCTLDRAETLEVDEAFAAAPPTWSAARPSRAAGDRSVGAACSCPRRRRPTACTFCACSGPPRRPGRPHDPGPARTRAPATTGPRAQEVAAAHEPTPRRRTPAAARQGARPPPTGSWPAPAKTAPVRRWWRPCARAGFEIAEQPGRGRRRRVRGRSAGRDDRGVQRRWS